MDKTGLMIDIMKMEVQKFNGIKDKFIDEFSKDDFDYIDQVCNIIFKLIVLSIFCRDGRISKSDVVKETR